MPRTLYISDLDGTLLNRESALSPYTIETLNSLIARGLDFTVATARSWSSASKVTAGLNLRLPVIVYNGAFMLAPETHRHLIAHGFSKEEMAFVRSLASSLGISPLVYAFVGDKEQVSWIPALETPGITFYIGSRRNDKRFRPVENDDMLYEGEAFYYTCIDAPEVLAPMWEKIKEDPRFTVTFQQELYREEYWLEIMPKKATKAYASAELKSLFAYDKLVVFGDALNDLPLFAAGDESCAVGNAVDAVKAAATRVIGTNEEDGVARWLLENATLSPFSLRPYAQGDIEEIISLFYDTVHTVNAKDYTPEELAAWVSDTASVDRESWQSSLMSHFTLVAEKDRKLLAFGDLDEETGYLDRLYVHKDFQGMGIASALLSAMENRARASGNDTVEVHASRTALGFFQSHGYCVIRSQQVLRKGVYLENFLMKKTLK